MSHSIRLRFVDWLHGVADKIGDGIPQALRHDQVHANPMGNQNFPAVVSVSGSAPERKVDGSVLLAILRHNIDECRNDAGVLDFDFASKQALAACHNSPDLIAHNAIPYFENLTPAPFLMASDGIVRPLFCEVQSSKQAASV
jgi:hypothetical protein